MLYHLVRALLSPLFRSRIETVTGIERLPTSGPFLVAINHNDYLDGFFVAVILTHATDRLVTFLTVSKNYWWTGGAMITIDHEHKGASLEAALVALEKGTIICVFPEGQRNPSATLLSGKTGIARLALWSGLPVVPIGLRGLSGTSMPNSIRRFLTGRERIRIAVGRPLSFPKVEHGIIDEPRIHAATDAIMTELAGLAGKNTPPRL